MVLNPRIAFWFLAFWFFALQAIASPPAGASTQEKFPDREGQVEFSTPSGNIGCTYTPAGGTSGYRPQSGGPELSCDRIKPKYVNITLGPSGPARRTDNPAEQKCCGADNHLAFGKTWKAGPFTCKSGPLGLTCLRDRKHGFVLGKTVIRAN